jgi:acyl carrier protein
MSTSDRIRAYIADELLGSSADGFDDRTPLLSGLLDSGALMRLVVFLEEEFDIDVDDGDVVPEHFANVETIERLVAAKRGETGPS